MPSTIRVQVFPKSAVLNTSGVKSLKASAKPEPSTVTRLNPRLSDGR